MDAEGDLQVEGPIVDEETGVRNYTVSHGDRQMSFGIAPQPSAEGVAQWVMLPGSERVVGGEHGTEPYDDPEEAFMAGLRAAREALQGDGSS